MERDDDAMSSLPVGALVAGSYLLGSVPFALLLGLSQGCDIRRVGSGNIGATNLGRALGRSWGIGAFLLDYAKGLLPVLVAVNGDWDDASLVALACAAAAIVGHVFPIYLGFRGGKGVAVTFGTMTGLAFLASLAAGIIWLAVYKFTKWVSVASLAAGVAFPLGVWLSHAGTPFESYLALEVFAILVAVLIVVRHRSNIIRLLKGQEFPATEAASEEKT